MGWFRAAIPSGGQTTLTVVWDGWRGHPANEGSWRYDLRWMHLPEHPGYIVNLSFDLPAG